MDNSITILLPLVVSLVLDIDITCRFFLNKEKTYSNNLFAVFAVVVSTLQLITIISYAHELGYIHVPSPLLLIFYILGITGLSVVSYSWFFYVLSVVKSSRRFAWQEALLFSIPVLFFFVATCISPWTDTVFTIDVNGHYLPGEAFALQIIIPYIYIFIAAIIVLRKMRTDPRKETSHILNLYIEFAIPTTLGMLCQLFLFRGGYTQIGISAGLLLMYLEIYVVDLSETKRLRSIADLHKSLQQANEHIRLAQLDTLTGLSNRYVGTDEVNKRLAEKTPFTLLLLDVDKFKFINDTYGHPVGDEVLKVLAQKLNTSFGDSIPVRMGGDEFMVIIDGKHDVDQIASVMNPFFDEVQHMQVPGIDGEQSYSVSVGIASYDGSGTQTFEDLYHTSDRRLYQSKRHEGCRYTYLI